MIAISEGFVLGFNHDKKSCLEIISSQNKMQVVKHVNPQLLKHRVKKGFIGVPVKV